jgi:hypothetical protein
MSDTYPKPISEVGEDGYKNYLHIAPEDREYQRGWDDGFYGVYPDSLDLMIDEYWAGYQEGIDQEERER